MHEIVNSNRALASRLLNTVDFSYNASRIQICKRDVAKSSKSSEPFW
jgi:hypothetical protein